MEPADWLGWAASFVLLAPLGRQVQVQWRERSTQGLSGWLFAGPVAASTGFVAYSLLVGNTVFVVTNLAIGATAVAGQLIYRRNRRLEGAGCGSVDAIRPTAGPGTPATLER